MNKYGSGNIWHPLGWCMFLFIYIVSFAHAADIAIIKSASIKPYEEALRGFKSIVGGNIREYDLQGDIDNGKEVITKVFSQKTSLLYAIGTKASIVAQQNTNQLPIVFSMVSRPQKYGLNKSNMAGVSVNIPAEAQFKSLKRIMPDVKRLGVIYNPESTKTEIEQAKQAAHKLGLELLAKESFSQQDVPKALRNIVDKIDVLWLTMDETFLSQLSIRNTILFATRSKIPVIGFSPRLIRDGALLALKADYFDMGVQAGELAMAILKKKESPGGKIVPPRKIIPVINMKVAEFMGLKIDPQFLKQCELYE